MREVQKNGATAPKKKKAIKKLKEKKKLQCSGGITRHRTIIFLFCYCQESNLHLLSSYQLDPRVSISINPSGMATGIAATLHNADFLVSIVMTDRDSSDVPPTCRYTEETIRQYALTNCPESFKLLSQCSNIETKDVGPDVDPANHRRMVRLDWLTRDSHSMAIWGVSQHPNKFNFHVKGFGYLSRKERGKVILHPVFHSPE